MKLKEHFFDHPQAPGTQTVEKAASAEKINAQKTTDLAKIHAKILQPNMMAVKRVQKVKKVAAKKVNLSTTERKASKPRDNAVPHLRKRAAANAKKTPKAKKATQEEKVALNIEKLKAE